MHLHHLGKVTDKSQRVDFAFASGVAVACSQEPDLSYKCQGHGRTQHRGRKCLKSEMEKIPFLFEWICSNLCVFVMCLPHIYVWNDFEFAFTWRHRKNVPRTKSEDVRELQRVRNTGAKLIQAMVKMVPREGIIATSLQFDPPFDPLANSVNVAERNVTRQFFLGTLVDIWCFNHFWDAPWMEHGMDA